jgi:hypothetical protein
MPAIAAQDSQPQIRRVLVIGVDPAQATHRLRIAILPALLEPLGYRFDIVERPAGFWARRRLLGTAGRYHAVILQRKLLDPSHARLLRRLCPRIFFDVDDAVMVQRRQIGRASAWLKRRRYLATAAVADHVVAGNEYLAEQFRQLGRPVTLLPTVVNPADYPVKLPGPTDRPALVWIGSQSTLPYLQQWIPQLEAAVDGHRLGVANHDGKVPLAVDFTQDDDLLVLHLADDDLLKLHQDRHNGRLQRLSSP